MEKQEYNVYRDIQKRTNGEIYIGVVGPVRSGKSTFVRRFMELFAIPNLEEDKKKEVLDQLPVSGSGKTITTVEPKFVPRYYANVPIPKCGDVKIRLIDCVGFMIPNAAGEKEGEKDRLVKTPWSQQPMPFSKAAEIGTKKVITTHSTVGIIMTSDGSFGEFSREDYIKAEEKTVEELKKYRKPFILVINSKNPYTQSAKDLKKELEDKYQAATLCMNCEQLRNEDIHEIWETLIYEFPVRKVEFYWPKWVEMLKDDQEPKQSMITQIREWTSNLNHIRDMIHLSFETSCSAITETVIDDIDLSTGVGKVKILVDDRIYYEMITKLAGIPITDEYDLIASIKDYAELKEEYDKVKNAIAAVKGQGYGVVIPELKDIQVDTPVVIKQGSRYGVQIKANSPSIHFIRANIETEISPIVGSEEQAKDLISYINQCEERGESIWETNIFGKTVEQLVTESIHSKISSMGEASQSKLQETMQKIVNDSRGKMVCIII